MQLCMFVGGPPETDARVAVEGDTVTVHYKCMNAKGEVSNACELAYGSPDSI